MKQAITLFKQGKFNETEQILSNLNQINQDNFTQNFLNGYIALIQNSPIAEKWLTKANQLRSKDLSTKLLLSEFYYRKDKFQEASDYLESTGNVSKFKKLRYFEDKIPYQIEENKKTTLKLITIDPLPVVQVKINGYEPVNFFIDTGGGELILDTSYAKKIDIKQFGDVIGTFGGGKKGKLSHGAINSFEIGGLKINNLPINILTLGDALNRYFKNLKIVGAIGTIFLYHFLSTLDYKNKELILRPRTEKSYEEFKIENQSKQMTSIPFWLCDDHYMVAWGTVNQSKPHLFLVDTGMVGGAFTCPKNTIKDAKINLDKRRQSSGMGGGGSVKILNFEAKEITLGSLKQKNLPCQYGPFPSTLEKVFGFHIGGLISHNFFKKYAITMDFDRMQYYLA